MKKTLLFITLFTICFGANAQVKPFWKEIQNFKKKDSIQMPAPGGIVFVGSSSFTNWKDLETVYKSYNAINRGFGGSTLAQANLYVKDIVFPYKPRQVVIYSGENDIAEGVSAIETLNRFAAFFTSIKNQLPEASIVYISMKSSPSRTKNRETVDYANNLIKAYLTHYKNTAFVDVDTKMKTADNKLRPELFLSDMLHMKPAGYEIWIKELTPYLLK